MIGLTARWRGRVDPRRRNTRRSGVSPLNANVRHRIVSRNFAATCVSMDEDSDLWLVGFADAEFNTQRYLRLQRGKSLEAELGEDTVLGPDAYHVEVDDQSRSCYEGIKRFELFHDHAVVEFEDATLPVLGGEKVIVVEFALRQQQLDQLRACLAKIFKGYDCFLDRSA